MLKKKRSEKEYKMKLSDELLKELDEYIDNVLIVYMSGGKNIFKSWCEKIVNNGYAHENIVNKWID